MEIIHSEIIPEVMKIKPTIYRDSRGSFVEIFIDDELFTCRHFVQDNISSSEQNVLRGLHYQLYPCEQGKLVTCIEGIVFDVAVDIRKESKTFGQWTSFMLNGENREQVWIPEGFAHGFYTTTGKATITYKVTDFYSPEDERTLIWNDPDIGIKWNNHDIIHPIISEKDKLGKTLKELMSEL